jgi:hypothetical protein
VKLEAEGRAAVFQGLEKRHIADVFVIYLQYACLGVGINNMKKRN